MFMRFMRLKVREDRTWDLQRFYRERVVPALQTTPGCVFASLLQPAVPGGECVSMTLWSGPEFAQAYESGGLFRELLDEAGRYLVREGEAARSPGVETYHVVTGRGPGAEQSASPRLHVRIVTLMVRDGQSAALADRFRLEIVPALLAVRGCAGAFLVEEADRPNQALSITLWERDEDAVRYELSGAFDALTSKLNESLSGLYLWRHSLAATADHEAVTGGDLHVDRYSLVVGQLFQENME